MKRVIDLELAIQNPGELMQEISAFLIMLGETEKESIEGLKYLYEDITTLIESFFEEHPKYTNDNK